MKIYRISVPASVIISVPAEDEEQAKRIAAAATWTPVLPLLGCDDHSHNHSPLGVAVWVHDRAWENPSESCDVLDVSENHDPALWQQPLRAFAELNANRAELTAALTNQPSPTTT